MRVFHGSGHMRKLPVRHLSVQDIPEHPSNELAFLLPLSLLHKQHFSGLLVNLKQIRKDSIITACFIRKENSLKYLRVCGHL